MWRLTTGHHISFLQINFQLDTYFPSKFCVFLPQTHLALLKDRFLKKMLLKKSKNPSTFSHKTMGLNDYFILIENNIVFFFFFFKAVACGEKHPVVAP